MRTTIRHASLSVLVLCICTACASAGGGRREPGIEQNTRFVQVIDERNGDYVFYQLGDSVGDPLGRGRFRFPLAETGIRPSYEVAWPLPR